MADYSVPSVDFFGKLSAIGDSYAARRKEAERKALLSGAISNGGVDYGRLMSGAAALGDMQTVLAADQMRRDQRDFTWRQSESERQQRNADRQYDLSARKGVQYKTDANGNIIRIDENGRATIVTPEGAPQAPTNPFSSGGKLTESEGKASGFADRMLQSEKVLQGVESAGTDAWQYMVANAPFVPAIARNNLYSKEYQQYDQARRDFINAQLRRESGAVITPAEFDNANKQYFPMPGDSKEVLKQKAANRRAAVEAMGREGGRFYSPKFIYGQDGRVVERPQNAPAAPQGLPQGLPQGARQAADGNYYVPDPNRPGKYLMVQP